MSKYLLCQSESAQIIDLNLSSGYKMQNHYYANLVLYDKKQIENVLNKKYLKKYYELLKLIEESDDDDAYKRCLFEEENLYNLLEGSYQKYFAKNRYIKYLGNLNNIRNYLQNVCINKKGR